MEWKHIKTAPNEEGILHIRGLWVYSNSTGKQLYFDACAGYVQDGFFVAANGDDWGWKADDFSYWIPLPEPPKL